MQEVACANPISTDTPKGPILVRCKQCLQCRIYKQSSLTLRCLLENTQASSGQFWTLTYADAPEVGDYKDFQNFLSRLRVINSRQGNPLPIRYLGTGEYGAKSGRFHFHALIWNNALDLEHRSPETARLRTRLWPHGFVYIGTVTPSSIRYTARYTLKFEEKGREARAGWSRNPPLGGGGIAQIARYMRARGDTLKGPPVSFAVEGKSYPLDQTMQLEFLREWHMGPVHPRALSNGASAHLAWAEHFRLGDPIDFQRLQWEDRAHFWESARFSNGKL